MAKMCYSCGAPIEDPEFRGESDIYCKYCVGPNGELKSRRDIQEGVAHWMMNWQPGISMDTALRRSDHYLRAMPAWADE